ncbi:hypothetical protein ACFCX3_22475 [Streptomyces virginiae]|uniref:hypothetical protein n=1 Tax=Streptomyces virginiae TaxID=1961 RepID=UPI0035DB39A5
MAGTRGPPQPLTPGQRSGPYHGIEPEALEFLEPEDLAELVAAGEIGPVQPGFEPF